MKFSTILSSFFTLLVMSSACTKATNSEQKIVRGREVGQESPAYLSAVRLEMGGGLCTGSIIGPRLILTAAHCVVDTQASQIKVYFDRIPSTSPDNSRKAVKAQTFKPFGAALFPNFDIAWVELEADVPAPYQPIEILRDANNLESSTNILLAGFGKQADVCNTSDCTGFLREANTHFEKYYDKAHIQSLLVFHGPKESGLGGACNGDSGGPAYAEIAGKWYLIGVTNGLRGDITPESDNNCDGGWDIYTSAGDYVSWLEQSSGSKIVAPDLEINQERSAQPLVVTGPSNKVRPSTWAEWVGYANHEDPAFYTVDSILQNFVNQTEDHNADTTAMLFDASRTEPLAATTESLYLQGETVSDLAPLKTFYSLKELTLDRTAVSDLSGLSTRSSLRYLGVREFAETAPDTVLNTLGDARKTLEKLEYEEVPAGIQNSIDWTAFQNLKEVGFTKAKGVLDLSTIKPRLLPNDSVLDLSTSEVKGQLKLSGFFNSKLSLSNLLAEDGDLSAKVDWTSFQGLKALSLDNFDSKAFPNFVDFVGLSELSLQGNNLTTISDLTLPAQIATLDVSSNRLSALDVRAQNIAVIKAYDNPFADVSCPAESCQTDIFKAPASLEQYCANASSASKNEFEEPYFRTLMLIQQQAGGSPTELDCARLNQVANRVRFLDLSASGLTDIRPLAFLGLARSISLEGNSIEDVSPLLGLANLESLSLSNNRISSLPSLATLTRLSTLDVMGNPLSAFKADAPQLKKLYLGEQGATGTKRPFDLTLPAESLLEGLYLGGLELPASSLASLHASQTLRTLYYADDTKVDSENWNDSLNLSLIASSQANLENCGLINGSCVQQSETEVQTVLGPLLGTTSGMRIEATEVQVYLPGLNAPIQTNNFANTIF
jgi:Leucine-rich repeat (LRR) protein/V8-like Glu-specific endopeptidase